MIPRSLSAQMGKLFCRCVNSLKKGKEVLNATSNELKVLFSREECAELANKFAKCVEILKMASTQETRYSEPLEP